MDTKGIKLRSSSWKQENKDIYGYPRAVKVICPIDFQNSGTESHIGSWLQVVFELNDRQADFRWKIQVVGEEY